MLRQWTVAVTESATPGVGFGSLPYCRTYVCPSFAALQRQVLYYLHTYIEYLLS